MNYLNEIETRLSTIDKAVVYRSEAVLSLDAALDKSRQSGVYVYVTPLGERPDQSPVSSGRVRQTIRDIFGVLFVVNTLNDDAGKRSLEKLKNARHAVQDLLLGFQPESATVPIERMASDLMKTQKAVVYWLDRYTTQHIEIQS